MLGELWIDCGRARGPAIGTLNRVAFGNHVFFFTTHAFVFDFWSVHVCVAEDGFDFGKDTHGLST